MAGPPLNNLRRKMSNKMKTWTDLDILTTDYKNALEEEDNNFSKKILSFLNTSPQTLVNEFKNHPGARLVAKNGDWLSLWAGGSKINGEFYENEEIINRIDELIKK
jgi:hypothetical protein